MYVWYVAENKKGRDRLHFQWMSNFHQIKHIYITGGYIDKV